MATVNEIIDFIEREWADIHKTLEWDFSGRQIYLENRKVNKVCLALDPLLSVMKQAVEGGCELLLTHHPLFFKPLQGLFSDRHIDSSVIYAVKNNLNVLSYHTNLDIASNGINHYFLNLLGARYESVLSVEGETPWYKLVVFAPKSHESTLLDVITEVGAGTLGNYRGCTFTSKGVGTFTPVEGATPYRGVINSQEQVQEVRIETLVHENQAAACVEAVRKAHPYEMPAIDLTPVVSADTYGVGAVGVLDRALSLKEMTALLLKTFNASYIAANSNEEKLVKKIAVVAGSGSGFWREAVKVQADILITGDLKHHDALDAREAGLSIIDLGHFSLEKAYMNYFGEVLAKHFKVTILTAEERPSIVNIT